MMSQCRLFSVGVLFLLSVVSVPHVWAQATLENPQPDSFQSGIGIISGWACNARRIEITFDGGARQATAYGTSRGDTRQVCGDTDNGFGLLFNWNLLGDGVHTVVAYADGVEFASTTVIVTTLGQEFLRGVSDSYTLSDFPDPGATTCRTAYLAPPWSLRWVQRFEKGKTVGKSNDRAFRTTASRAAHRSISSRCPSRTQVTRSSKPNW